MRFGPRHKSVCADVSVSGFVISWITSSTDLGVDLLSSNALLPRTKLTFIRPSTTFLEKLDATLQRNVLFALIKSKCLPVLFYRTEACTITSADKHSLEFTMNKVLYKIFWAMSKDSYGELCKYFGIDKVEE